MQKGFTLVEVLVSVSIFATVMVVSLGTLLSMSDADRKAQTLKSVVNNLNFAMESMSRSIRTGYLYACDPSVPISGSPTPTDCTNGADSLGFLSSEGEVVVYRLETSDRTLCGQPIGQVGCIVRSQNGGLSFYPVTAPEVVVRSYAPASYMFYVNGAQALGVQPKVTILLSGTVEVSVSEQSSFNLQTSVTQRLYDQ